MQCFMKFPAVDLAHWKALEVHHYSQPIYHRACFLPSQALDLLMEVRRTDHKSSDPHSHNAVSFPKD
jgi:hypothetical protein